MSSSDEEDIALTRLAKKSSSITSASTYEDDDEDDIPLAKKSRKKRVESDYEEDYEDDIPLKKRKLSNGRAKQVKKEPKTKSKSTSTKDTKVKKEKTTVKKETKSKKESKTASSTKVKEEPKSQSDSQASVKSETPEEDQGYKWWEANEETDDIIKWQTLEHNGVIFPPPYEPLPSHVKLYYNNKPVNLPPEAEEVAGFYGAMLETDHAKNPVFQKNFFNDFLEVLKECGGCGVEIKDFEKLDFSKMYAHFEKLREEKKAMSKEEKKRIKEEKEKEEEPFKTCYLNGRKELVGNFRIEPPGLFRGRGAHPKTGKLKRRVAPEQVTLNLSKDAKIPEPPAGHQWGEIRHDNEVTWLAMWKENISDSLKYVRFANNSSVKGQSDFKKFETARKLRNYVDDIRKDYTKMLKSEKMQDRQMATAMYLIDVFALRAGGEKGEDEADTVGCCSLRYEHVTLKPPNKVIFDFLGKDSIRFYQEVEVDKQVFKNLRIFKKSPKQPGDDLFDRINPSLVNRQLQYYMKGLTAKVFRTYNASKTMQDQIDLIENEGTVAEKVVKFNAANRTVAILCNHQRTVSKTHGDSIQRINDKLKEFMWQKIRLKKMILQLEPKLKKKDPKYFEEIEDLIKEDIEHIHHTIIKRQREQVKKKLERDNEKLKLEGKPLLTESDIKDKLDKIDELEKEYKKELKTGKPIITKNATVEKLKQQIETLENRILNVSFQLKDKEDNSEVSLGTSKMNYIDPRLTVMFSKKFDVPIEKLFTKTLREKFNWAIESTDENWRF
ncbi:DNA topoisomerase, putative [Candida dubliniensis CD36]|uniref:DNA topoisomerase I n=1 Tax=Candida dubliniensis (strain CD36 / ATCC MYA-646 / CBS 7987 / NCPF 3949 / NRRL Y-17841) TaxID=573826 RepID=B9WIH6_CANDC|nr:DNA topoisomerase, putative [Candida dubliniensis CD36]CAX41041.1 DNA topoisomerase, putative [Candida dubliniensis CD36]